MWTFYIGRYMYNATWNREYNNNNSNISSVGCENLNTDVTMNCKELGLQIF